jgi:hypothetical protein
MLIVSYTDFLRIAEFLCCRLLVPWLIPCCDAPLICSISDEARRASVSSYSKAFHFREKWGFLKAGKSTFFELENLTKQAVFYPIFPP